MSNVMECEVSYFSCYHLLSLLNNFEDMAGRPDSIIGYPQFCFHLHFKILSKVIQALQNRGTEDAIYLEALLTYKCQLQENVC